MAAQSVIITNPNSCSRIFSTGSYVSPYSADYNSSESSDSSSYIVLETIPVQMNNLSSYSDISNQSFVTIDPVQRRQLQFQESEEPYLSIVEQPKNQLRFRYKSEKGKHGGLKPIVKLNNYHNKGDIFIKVSLYTNEENPSLHVFDLEAKTFENGSIQQKLSKDYTARFPSLSVYTKKKDEILLILENRIKKRCKDQRKKINEQAIKKEAQEEIKKLSLNAGRLCFEAFHDSKPIGGKIFSDPFYDQKCTSAGDLKIIRLSSFSGKSYGGDDIILLCEKIRKDDIEIHFYEESENGEVLWEGKGEFNPGDVHHQVAIPFKTPQFRENIERKVNICLFRKSDQKSGEALEFLYIKDEQWNEDFSMKSSKRKKLNLSESAMNQQTESFSSSLDFLSACKWEENCNLGELFNLELLEDTFQNDELGVENVNMDAVVSSVSLALSKAKIQNSTILNKRNSSSNGLTNRIKDLMSGILNILKTRDVDSFLNFLPVLMKLTDEKHNTLLHLVIQEKSENLELLFRLLQVAPKDLINQKNKLHLTPLHLAVSNGLWKHIRVLLRFEANPNIKNQEGSNCVHLAAMYNLPQCLCEILAPLLCDKTKNILPDINALNYKGFAPLHITVMNESEKCTELLVKSKANINIMDGKSGKTPLHMAYECQNPKLKEFLSSQPHINRRATDFRGYAPCSVISYAKSESENSKPTECCIEMSSEFNHSIEESSCKNNKEDFPTVEELEQKLVEILSSNELWKTLGIYLMEEKELDMIKELESVPARAILKEFKEKHEENYLKELKKIFSSDGALKYAYKQLPMSHL